jgi:hypothetical protein
VCSRGWLRFSSITLACAALVFAASCEFPFSLRDSEPSTGSTIKIVDPTDPGVVRTNMWRCYLGRDATFYNEQLVPDFVFFLDPIDAAELQQTYGGDFSQWDVTTERDLTTYLLDGARCSLVLCVSKNLTDVQCIPDSTVLENTETMSTIQYSYRFNIILYNVFTHVSGQARLFIRKEPSDNLWHMYKWEDIRPQSETDRGDTLTLGMLKGQLLATK